MLLLLSYGCKLGECIPGADRWVLSAVGKKNLYLQTSNVSGDIKYLNRAGGIGQTCRVVVIKKKKVEAAAGLFFILKR